MCIYFNVRPPNRTDINFNNIFSHGGGGGGRLNEILPAFLEAPNFAEGTAVEGGPMLLCASLFPFNATRLISRTLTPTVDNLYL